MSKKRLNDIFGDSVDNFLLEVQMGYIKGASIVWKFGRKETVTTTETDIWCGNPQTYTFPDNPGTLSIVSDNVADTQLITVEGLDANWEAISETVTLNGTTPVITTNSFIRVNRAYNSNGVEHLGDISFTHSDAGVSIACVRAYAQQTLQAIYSVPAGYTAYLFRGMASAGKGKDAQILFKYRLTDGVFRLAETFGLYENTYEAERPYLRFPEKTDLKVSAISSSAGTDISSQFGILLLDNSLYE